MPTRNDWLATCVCGSTKVRMLTDGSFLDRDAAGVPESWISPIALTCGLGIPIGSAILLTIKRSQLAQERVRTCSCATCGFI